MAKLREFCMCGSAVTGTVEGRLPRGMVADLAEQFWSCHQGKGHGPTTQRKAAQVRRRANRA